MESKLYIAITISVVILSCSKGFLTDSGMIVWESMNKVEFCRAMNNAWINYAEKVCHCNVRCFLELDVNAEWDEIFSTINKNFRTEIYQTGMSFDELCIKINDQFSKPIYRFCDAKQAPTQGIDWSLDVFRKEIASEEPSAIVSPDSCTLYIYAHQRRYETSDGIHYSEGIPLVTDRYVMHGCVNYIEGVYYYIGENNSSGPMLLFTSTDGLDFSYRGVIFPNGMDIHGDGSLIAEYYGNPYLLKMNGVFYLYYEIRAENDFTWEMCVATCTDILEKRENGYLGNWTQYEGNPIVPSKLSDDFILGAGNFDFARGMDNQPIISNDKYYVYFHAGYGTAKTTTAIYRAYSYDLFNWTIEGVTFDNRDIPTNPNITGNGDHCVIEFKGKTYLFYTYDINQTPIIPRLKILIDNRPFSELLTLLP